MKHSYFRSILTDINRRRRMWLLALVLIAVAPLRAQLTPDPEKAYAIHPSRAAAKCLSVSGSDVKVSDPNASSTDWQWKFEATGTANVYNIKNVGTGKYLGSCNGAENATIQVSDTPVPYYMGYNATGPTTKGYYYFSSTDVSNYSTPSETTKCINYNEGRKEAVVFKSSENRRNSYWSITEATTPDTPATPDTVKFEAGAYYNIFNYGNNSLYMGSTSDASLEVMSNTAVNRIWWQFEPTGKVNCYYVKNATTGQYIQQLKSKGANTYISLGNEKVEYYIGHSTASDVNGGYWFSSTNTTGYSTESESTLALNKDGASNRILTWVADGSDKNSYWLIQKSDYTYDPTPFTPSNGTSLYNIKSATTSQALESDGSSTKWAAQSMKKSQQWYFTGVSNKAGGYQIVSAQTAQPIDTLHYVVEQVATGYVFRHAYAPKEALKLGNDTVFYFEAARSQFSLAAQIYDMPCGTLGQPRVKSASLTGTGVRTPLVCGDNAINPQGANTVWTKSRPVLAAGGKGTLTVTLNNAPAEGTTAYLYFDWDRDGFFEQQIPLTVAQTMTQEIQFPTIGDGVKEGQSHMRLRITSNGLSGADDDVEGQSVDFIISLTADNTEFKATATPNDASRGKATINGNTATATPTGKCTFVCWKEQNNVLSTEPEYTFTLDHDVNLIAVFSPDPDGVSTGISAVKSDGSISITVSGKKITATAASPVKAMYAFNPSGTLVAKKNGNVISMHGQPTGVYIVKAHTAKGSKTVKLVLE